MLHATDEQNNLTLLKDIGTLLFWEGSACLGMSEHTQQIHDLTKASMDI